MLRVTGSKKISKRTGTSGSGDDSGIDQKDHHTRAVLTLRLLVLLITSFSRLLLMSHGTEFLFWGTIWACILYGVGGVFKKGTILFVLLDRHVSGSYGLFARLFYSPIVRRMKTHAFDSNI